MDGHDGWGGRAAGGTDHGSMSFSLTRPATGGQSGKGRQSDRWMRDAARHCTIRPAPELFPVRRSVGRYVCIYRMCVCIVMSCHAPTGRGVDTHSFTSFTQTHSSILFYPSITQCLGLSAGCCVHDIQRAGRAGEGRRSLVGWLVVSRLSHCLSPSFTRSHHTRSVCWLRCGCRAMQMCMCACVRAPPLVCAPTQLTDCVAVWCGACLAFDVTYL